ncbi:hypothetical protein BH09PAT1_BH09PAT1_7450 [soil metagenome]
MKTNESISEREFIKKCCRVECKWENDNQRWVVKINHITKDKAFSSVRVAVNGFENFREACDEAIKLFKRNIRNKITDAETIKANYTEEDIWPEIIT